MFLIIGKYKGKSEVIDQTDNEKHAEYMVGEYADAWPEYDISMCRDNDEPV